MCQWLQQLFCKHDYVSVNTEYVNNENPYYVETVRCWKCKKIKTLYYYRGNHYE